MKISRGGQIVALVGIASAWALAVCAATLGPRGAYTYDTRHTVMLALAAVTAVTVLPRRTHDEDVWARRITGATCIALAALRVLGVAVAFAKATGHEAVVQLYLAALLELTALTLAEGPSLRRALALAAAIVGGAVIAEYVDARVPGRSLWLLWSLLAMYRTVRVEAWLRAALPVTDDGRLAPWRHPGPRWLTWPLDLLANSRVVQLAAEPLPVGEMVSDIAGVVYVNWLVEASRLERFVPAGLELQRLGPDGRWALFTALTYHHGHFGFRALGPVRRLFPSPIQTNWRVHVVDPRTGVRGIRFVTNAIDYAVPALGARLFSEGMPMHVLRSASVVREADGAVRVALDPGEGSAPDLTATLHVVPGGQEGYRSADRWTAPWSACFSDLRAFLDYCVPQDRAMDAQPWRRRI